MCFQEKHFQMCFECIVKFRDTFSYNSFNCSYICGYISFLNSNIAFLLLLFFLIQGPDGKNYLFFPSKEPVCGFLYLFSILSFSVFYFISFSFYLYSLIIASWFILWFFFSNFLRLVLSPFALFFLTHSSLIIKAFKAITFLWSRAFPLSHRFWINGSLVAF